jgi:2-keto-4-pentenoate hydratase/2-oxohepta-3-ene-1,7-dioic acid hydratase in catechol pathway
VSEKRNKKMNRIILSIKNSSKTYEVRPEKIVCLGLNYAEHALEHSKIHKDEQSKNTPTEPILFPKFPNVLIGPDVDIVYPKILQDVGKPRMDYEGELAVIIGKQAKNVKKEHAFDYIFGYTIFNDVTARNLQTEDIQNKKPWLRSKSIDTFGPIGPVVVKKEDLPDPQNLQLTTKVNGVIKQDGNTNQMIFKIDFLIEYISKYMTLEPGDIISTGTPSGVGEIQIGDTVEIEIEKIGVLRNKVA